MLNPLRTNLIEGYRERGLRRRLVEELKAKGIANASVLAAIGTVKRHAFFEEAFITHAYQDKAFPIGAGQTISQPYTVARQTELIEPRAGMRVLEIGTGSGYQCAVLCELGIAVYTVEYQGELARRAKVLLERMGYKPVVALHGDGSGGMLQHAPFDAILVTAGAPAVPSVLTAQLAPGGRLVIPVGDLATQTMVRITKLADGTLKEERLGGFRFVPLKGKEGWK
jgi:protein-L-isoaspartate(D-aspartate) O-methyltransferase